MMIDFAGKKFTTGEIYDNWLLKICDHVISIFVKAESYRTKCLIFDLDWIFIYKLTK